jgi:hypothetical protein
MAATGRCDDEVVEVAKRLSDGTQLANSPVYLTSGTPEGLTVNGDKRFSPHDFKEGILP